MLFEHKLAINYVISTPVYIAVILAEQLFITLNYRNYAKNLYAQALPECSEAFACCGGYSNAVFRNIEED